MEGGGVELSKEEKHDKYRQLFKELMMKAQKLPPGSASKRTYMAKARNAKAMADALAYNKEKGSKESQSKKTLATDAVTRATLEMIPELTQIVNWAYRGEGGWTTESDILTGRRTTEQELTEIVARCSSTAGEEFFAAIVDGKPVGCVRVVKESDCEAEIGMFAVQPDMQSQGVGRQLVDRAEEEAKSMGATMAVMRVLTPRTDILEWYKRRGYESTGIREELFESDLWEVVGGGSLFFEKIQRKL